MTLSYNLWRLRFCDALDQHMETEGKRVRITRPNGHSWYDPKTTRSVDMWLSDDELRIILRALPPLHVKIGPISAYPDAYPLTFNPAKAAEEVWRWFAKIDP